MYRSGWRWRWWEGIKEFKNKFLAQHDTFILNLKTTKQHCKILYFSSQHSSPPPPLSYSYSTYGSSFILGGSFYLSGRIGVGRFGLVGVAGERLNARVGFWYVWIINYLSIKCNWATNSLFFYISFFNKSLPYDLLLEFSIFFSIYYAKNFGIISIWV